MTCIGLPTVNQSYYKSHFNAAERFDTRLHHTNAGSPLDYDLLSVWRVITGGECYDKSEVATGMLQGRIQGGKRAWSPKDKKGITI